MISVSFTSHNSHLEEKACQLVGIIYRHADYIGHVGIGVHFKRGQNTRVKDFPVGWPVAAQLIKL